MDAWAQILLGLGALLGPPLGYLAAVRKSAGRIRSSDAADLWEESANLRRECQERVRALEARNTELQTEVYRLQRAVMGGGEA